MPKLFEISYEQRKKLCRIGWTPDPNEAGYFPTVAEALFWLRKDKNIYALIQMDETSYPKFCVVVKRWNGVGAFKQLHDFNYVSGMLHRTYDEAESVGLDFILDFLMKENN